MANQEQPKAAVPIRDFPGLNVKADAFDLVDGSSPAMVNVTVRDPGALKSRNGFRVVRFEE